MAFRLLLTTLILLMPLFGGCLGEGLDETEATPQGPEQPALPRFGEPTFIGEGGSSLSESSLDVGPDGSMLVCAVSTTDVWASEDAGETWRAFTPFGDVRNGDCDVAVSEDGHWYAVFARWEGPLGERDLSVAVSRDRGATWEEHAITPPLGLNRHCPVPPYGGCFAHKPWLQAVEGSLYLTYFNIEPATTFFQRSDDGGVTWSEPVVVDVDARIGINGDMVISEEGRTIQIPLVRAVPAGTDGQQVGVEDELRPWLAWYELATSTDGGTSWTTREVAGPVEVRIAFPSLARATSGELYFAQPLFNGSRVDLAVTVSSDGGATWSGPSVIARGAEPRPGEAYLAMDPSPEGGVVAAWMDWSDGRGSTGSMVKAAMLDARADELVQWTVDVTEPAGEPGTIEFFEISHGPLDRLHLAYPVPEAACQGATHRDCIYHVVGQFPSDASPGDR